MKRLGIVSLLLLGLLGVAGIGAPVISVDSAVYTATVQAESVVSHTFVLANDGDQTLTISKVQSSCECITTTLANSDVTPGARTGIEARVNTTGLSGQVEKTIEVQSNDPARSTLVLRVLLTIRDGAQAQPAPSSPPPARATSPAPTPVASAGNSAATSTPQPDWLLVVGGVLLAGLLLLLMTSLVGF